MCDSSKPKIRRWAKDARFGRSLQEINPVLECLYNKLNIFLGTKTFCPLSCVRFFFAPKKNFGKKMFFCPENFIEMGKDTITYLPTYPPYWPLAPGQSLIGWPFCHLDLETDIKYSFQAKLKPKKNDFPIFQMEFVTRN